MRYLKIGVCALILSIILECLVFNFDYWTKVVQSNYSEEELCLDDAIILNWEHNGESYISQEDPHIVWTDLSCNVKDLTISYSVNQLPAYVCIYYSTETATDLAKAAEFRADEQLTGKIQFSIEDTITSFRVDLGNQPGLELYHLSTTLNPRAFHFSVSRVVAVVFMAILAEFLFSLQKMPDYKLNRE